MHRTGILVAAVLAAAVLPGLAAAPAPAPSSATTPTAASGLATLVAR